MAIRRVTTTCTQRSLWRDNGGGTTLAEVDLGRTVEVGITDLREDIEHGQVIARYRVDGLTQSGWKALSRGTTIGYRKLDRFAKTPVRRVRVTIEAAVEAPRPIAIGVYAGA